MDDIEPDDPAEGTKAQTSQERWLSYYPLDRAVELTKAYFDSLPPPEDAVMLPGMSEEALEAELADMFRDQDRMPPEAQAEADQFKQFFRETRGKKLSELTPPTPEEDLEFFTGEAETGIVQLFSGWAQALWLWHEQDGETARLTTTLEPAGQIKELGSKSWAEYIAHTTPFSAEEIAELHAAFAAKMRAEIDGNPLGCRLSSDLLLKKDAQGYYLAP